MAAKEEEAEVPWAPHMPDSGSVSGPFGPPWPRPLLAWSPAGSLYSLRSASAPAQVKSSSGDPWCYTALTESKLLSILLLSLAEHPTNQPPRALG